MSSPAVVIETLESRYVSLIEAAADEIDRRRQGVEEKERDRDQLIIESAPVLRRATAARCARLSVSRIEQIIGGAA